MSSLTLRRSAPFWISVGIHVAVLGAAAVLFVKPVEFGMTSGQNSVEVNLIAAAPDPVAPAPPAPQPEEMVKPQPPQPDDVAIPAVPSVPITATPPKIQPVVDTPPKPAPIPPKPHHLTTVEKGDGSSPIPGHDATTAHSDAGAIMEAKPDYLSNPAPIYPEASRREKQEGLVVLAVIVDTEGHAENISLRNSSGFSPLDQAAITAVHKWRFRAASLGGMRVKSRVVIPVRFRLES